MLISLQARIIAGVVSIVVIIALLFGAKWIYDTLKEQRATINAIQSNAQAASDISDETDNETDARDNDTTHVIETRIEYRTKYEVLRDANPDVAAFDAMRIPLELRKLACERRLARDLNGSAPVEGGCERFDREAGDTGRD